MAKDFHCDHALENKKKIPHQKKANELAGFYKVFSDPTRIKILFAILDKPLCVHDLAKILHMEQSAVSHQLRVLRQAKLVKTDRQGRTIHYQLDDHHVSQILTMGSKHITENKE